jgi:gatB/yqey family protein
VQAKIAEIAEQVGATTQKEFGKLMGAVMQALKGQADGNVIKEQVKAHLNK